MWLPSVGREGWSHCKGPAGLDTASSLASLVTLLLGSTLSPRTWLLCPGLSSWLGLLIGEWSQGSVTAAWQLASQRQEVEVARPGKGSSGCGTVSLSLYYLVESSHRAQPDLRRWRIASTCQRKGSKASCPRGDRVGAV